MAASSEQEQQHKQANGDADEANQHNADQPNKKRSYTEMEDHHNGHHHHHHQETQNNGQPSSRSPELKRQKLSTNDNDHGITKEDMEFLFQMKQQPQPPLSSLHTTSSTNNLTVDINHQSNFATASIASTANSVAMSALSTTAAIDRNPSLQTFELDTVHNNNNNNHHHQTHPEQQQQEQQQQHQLVAADTLPSQHELYEMHNQEEKQPQRYCIHYPKRSSRVGDRYQAAIIPAVVGTTDNEEQQNDDRFGGTFLGNEDDAKYAGIAVTMDSPGSMAEKLRKDRDEKRSDLEQKVNSNHVNDGQEEEEEDEDDDEEEEEDGEVEPNGGNIRIGDLDFNALNAGDDDEDDDEAEDADFNMDEYMNYKEVRMMEGILGRKTDWLPGDDGHPNGQSARMQYLIKWKDSNQPEWIFADELDEAYQERIDEFYEDEMLWCDEEIEQMIINDKAEEEEHKKIIAESEQLCRDVHDNTLQQKAPDV